MPHRKPPQLVKREPRRDQDGKHVATATWFIRDGHKYTSTGCDVADLERAEEVLRRYIDDKEPTAPVRAASEAIKISTVLRRYRSRALRTSRRKQGLLRQLSQLMDFWGELTVDQITAETSQRYQTGRTPYAARNELATLRAAVAQYVRTEGIQLQFKPDYGITPPRRTVPDVLNYREFVAVLRAAHRARKPLKSPCLFRYVLFGFMTGARSSLIVTASFEREPGRPWIDLENGLLHLDIGSPSGQRRKPIELADRLLKHLRRWYADDRERHVPGCQYLIHSGGGNFDCRRHFGRLLRDVLGRERAVQVISGIFRNAFASWYLTRGASLDEVARYCLPPSTTRNDSLWLILKFPRLPHI